MAAICMWSGPAVTKCMYAYLENVYKKHGRDPLRLKVIGLCEAPETSCHCTESVEVYSRGQL